MRYRALQIIAFGVIGALLTATPSPSWQVIAHYQMGIESKVDESGWFPNLPDAWPSYDRKFQITEWFAWSHGMQRVGSNVVVPRPPINPNDGRDPGETMHKLYKKTTKSRPVLYETSLGFLIHNAQDREVHYGYFRGGSIGRWIGEHAWKEEWADCWVYRIRRKGTFNLVGRPTDLPTIRVIGDAALISEAQAQFIRSGLSVDSNTQTPLSKQESVREIESRLMETEANTRDYLTQFDWVRCASLNVYAAAAAWDIGELRQYYEKALDATQKSARKFPK